VPIFFLTAGAAQADVAVLVVNATSGEFETGFDAGGQTREHTMLSRSLGSMPVLYVISSNIICLQCFDAVGWVAGRASGL